MAGLKDAFTRRWFLIVLIAFLSLGFLMPEPLLPITSRVPREAIVAMALFLMALTLDASSIWRAMRQPVPVLLAVGVNFLLVPLAAWLLAPWMIREDLGVGLMIAAAVPSTMASAAVWTRRAGGNDAVALMGTVITNTACFVITPLWLSVSTGTEVSVPLGEMIRKLALIAVLPTLAGQAARLVVPVARWATAQKTALGILAQCGILTIVLCGAVTGGLRLGEQSTPLGLLGWSTMLGAVVGIHLATLWAGHALGQLLGVSRPDRIAVGFSGSQKTLMLGLYVATTYFGQFPLAMLPMIFYHICQLLTDTVIADRLRANSPC
jgi:sodium/bile acid cotransporter 7